MSASLVLLVFAPIPTQTDTDRKSRPAGRDLFYAKMSAVVYLEQPCARGNKEQLFVCHRSLAQIGIFPSAFNGPQRSTEPLRKPIYLEVMQ
jgi:hypothetical protein